MFTDFTENISWGHRHRAMVQGSSQGLSELHSTLLGRILRWNHLSQSSERVHCTRRRPNWHRNWGRVHIWGAFQSKWISQWYSTQLVNVCYFISWESWYSRVISNTCPSGSDNVLLSSLKSKLYLDLLNNFDVNLKRSVPVYLKLNAFSSKYLTLLGNVCLLGERRSVTYCITK